MTSSQANGIRPEDEVTRLCAELIRIPSVNAGDNQGPGERAASEWVMEQLHEVGLEPVLVESSPGRASVMVRIEGADPSLPGLVVHGHTDVVPANAVSYTHLRAHETVLDLVCRPGS